MASTLVRRLSRSIRWRLGMAVAAPELEQGTDQSVAAFYQSRVTDCGFLSDPNHYEHPRASWILQRVGGGRLLEIGAGNGGMTRLIAPAVGHVVALDISRPSLEAIRQLRLPNVQVVEALIERYEPSGRFDWIVMSEVLEHLRDPDDAVRRLIGWLAPGGRLLITTPHGHWESNEHLQEFTLERFVDLLARGGGETLAAGYLRDRDDRRRWLVGEVVAPAAPATTDQFDDRRTVAREHRTAGAAR